MVFLLVLATYAGFQSDPEPTFSDVFSKGDGGFAQIRIPSVIVTNRSTVLAFAEGRNTNKSDQGSNKIILRRSLDGGRTWGELQTIDDQGGASLNNPCAVIEPKSGRVLLMYQRIPAGTAEGNPQIPTGYDGPNAYESFFTSSIDDGQTWSRPVDITRQVKHPTGATTICSGPGIGIQLTRGKFKGRLVMPFNEGPYNLWNNYGVFSDNLGATWRFGKNAPGALVTESGKQQSQINEVQMAELSDGSILLNSRQFAGAKVRKKAISRDGGESWSKIEDVNDLVDPSCMGSLFRYSFGTGKGNVLLYSGPDSTDRKNGTVYASFDDGKTWPVKRVLVPGEFAYSVLTRFSDGTIGCLFETDGYRKIRFTRFSPNWLLSER